MRNSIKLALGASTLALSVPASAATFFFNSGNYNPGVTAPEPLMSPDILEMSTASSKIFFGVTMTNQSGTVNWNNGSLFLGSNAQVINQSLWNAFGNNNFSNTTGGGTFQNSGTFRKSGGTGTTSIGVNFINSGILDAQSGIINYTSNNNIFNSGSVFTGAGINNLSSNASFNGGFTSDNLDFNAGTFTGTNAALNGAADFLSGTFSGGWDITSGSTLNLNTGSSKIFFGGTFTNEGTMNWNAGTLFLGSGANLNNAGMFNATDDNSFTNTTGGGVLHNTGTLAKTGGTGTTSIGVALVNDGTLDAQTGRIRYTGNNSIFNAGTDFTGAGVNEIASNANFNGAFTSSNVDFASGTFTGTNAILNGSADILAGTFAGNWTVASGSDLNFSTASSKVFSGGEFTNDGALNWSGGALFLGGGVDFTNTGVIDSLENTIFTVTTGGGTLTNDGTIRKSGGIGDTTISASLVNNGILDAQSGTIRYTGSKTFNAGTVFTGAGINEISGNANFNDTFTSSNVDFTSGTFTGTNAALTGSADWLAGTFAGDWTVASGGVLDMVTASSKIFSGGTFTNEGTMNWASGALFLGGGVDVINAGLINETGNNIWTVTTGGGTVTNTGLFEKTAGAGTTNLSGIDLDNQGTINVLSGTILLPTDFTNDGTLSGTSNFSLSGTLTNNGIIAPGDIGATGTLGLNGNYLQSVGGSLATQLASTSMFDVFNITGTAALGGTLDLSCILTCDINTGDSFVILTSGNTLSGVFDNFTTSGFLNGFQYDIFYNYADNNVRLDIIDAGMAAPMGVPEPATWAMLIFGFGMIGGALRTQNRRRVNARFSRAETA